MLVIPIVCFKALVFPHVTSKAYLFYGLVEIITAVWIYAVLVDPTYRISRRALLWLIPFGAYMVWLTIAGMLSFNPHLSVWSSLMRGTGLLTLWHGFLFILVLMSLVQKYGKVFIYTVMQYTVAAGAVVGASIWFGDEGLRVPISVLQKGSGGGVVGNSSLAAAYLLFVVAFALILVCAKELKQKWWIYLSLFIIIGSPIFINIIGLCRGIGLLGSARAATAAIGIGAVVSALVLLVLSPSKTRKVIGWSGIAAGVIAFVVVWSQLMTSGTAIHTKFISETSDARFIFWNIAQNAMDERPLLGYGPENFSIAVQRHFDPQLLSKDSGFEVWSDRAHNIYYDTGVSGGYPAIVLYALLIASMIAAAYKAYIKGFYTRTEVAVFTGLVVAYVVQNLTVFDGFMSLFVLYITLAVLYGAFRTTDTSTYIVSDRYKPLLPVFLVAALVGAWYLSIRPIEKAYAFGDVLGDAVNKRPDRYKSLLDGASVGNDWDVSGFAHDEYKLYARDPLAVKSDQRLLPYGKKDIDAFIAYIETIANTNKTDYRLYLSIVHLYSTKIYLGDMPYDNALAEKIQSYIDTGRMLAPRDPQLYWADAQLAAWKGDIQGVVTAYQKGIELDPTLAPSHRLLVGFLKDTGNQKLYEQALKQARQDIPGFTL